MNNNSNINQVKLSGLIQNNVHYNIYLNSPQLAVNANRKKYYLHVINENNKFFNKKLGNYSKSYYNTSYKRIFVPYQEIIPY